MSTQFHKVFQFDKYGGSYTISRIKRYLSDRFKAVLLSPKTLKEREIERDLIENAKDIKKLDIFVLGISKRVYYKLQATGIQTIGELTKAIDKVLKRVRGIGDAAYEEIVRQIRKTGINSPL